MLLLRRVQNLVYVPEIAVRERSQLCCDLMSSAQPCVSMPLKFTLFLLFYAYIQTRTYLLYIYIYTSYIRLKYLFKPLSHPDCRLTSLPQRRPLGGTEGWRRSSGCSSSSPEPSRRGSAATWTRRNPRTFVSIGLVFFFWRRF